MVLNITTLRPLRVLPLYKVSAGVIVSMCGIFSITGENSGNLDDAKLEAMLDSLSRRGPDEHGVLKLPGWVGGHTRLSIIDLSGGHQPMQDGKLAVTFNEIGRASCRERV